MSNEKLISQLKRDVETNGGISGNRENPSLELLNSTQDSMNGVTKSKELLMESGLDDLTNEIKKLAEVRIYQSLSWGMAAIATIIQIVIISMPAYNK